MLIGNDHFLLLLGSNFEGKYLCNLTSVLSIENHCEYCKNFSSRLWSVLFTLSSFFLIHTRVPIKVSWIGKYDAFFIFRDTIFPTYPKNYNTKESFCFQNQGIKTFFFAVKVEKDFNMIIFIKTVMLVLSWYKILFSSITWSPFIAQNMCNVRVGLS